MPKQPNKRRRLTTTSSLPVYMSTRSKQKGPETKPKNPESHWTAEDEASLVAILLAQGAVPGGNYKPQVWNDVASKMRNPPERGAPKTASSCKSKWGRMKRHYQDVVEPLTKLSGIPWTPETGVGFSQDTPPSVRAVWHTYVTSHKKARPYEQGYPLYDSLQQLVPSEAKGQHAYHGRLAMQPQSPTMVVDGGNGSEDDSNEGDGDFGGVDGEGRAGGSGAAAEGSGVDSGSSALAGMPHTGTDGSKGLEDDRHPTPPPSSPSVMSKRPFSAIDSDSVSLPPSASQVPSTSSACASSSSSSKRGRTTPGAIALTHIGHNLSDFNTTYRYGIDKEQERHHARMVERKSRGQECLQAVTQAQELETYLTNEELAALIEVFEELNSAKAYLAIKTAEIRRAWIKRKLTALGIVIPSV